MEIFLLILFGILGGVLGGMGMGGGTVIIPLLTLFLNISQKFAQGYNLLAFLVMAIGALINHSKNKLVDYKSIIVLAISGVIFCFLGVYLATVIDNQILKYIFAGFLILLAIREFYEVFRPKHN